jgi:hypothetical protein
VPDPSGRYSTTHDNDTYQLLETAAFGSFFLVSSPVVLDFDGQSASRLIALAHNDGQL